MTRPEIATEMERAVKYYLHIDKVGAYLSDICLGEIQYLLDTKRFKEAKEAIREFYKPARLPDEDNCGDVMFIEHDMLMAKVNRMIAAHKNANDLTTELQ